MIKYIKKAIKSLFSRIKIFRVPAVFYCSENNLFPEVFVRTSTARLRELLLLPESKYETQLNQDIFALLVNRFGNGYFLEIGANDGYTISNTVYLEEKFGWNGLLVEANPAYEISLKNRKSKSIIAAITDKKGTFKFRAAGLYGGVDESLDRMHNKITDGAPLITVNGITLEQALVDHGAPSLINFVSIDVEGGELPIVRQLCDLRNFRFLCGCIEHNFRMEDYSEIVELLQRADYQVIWNGKTLQDLFFIDKLSVNE